MSAHAKLALVTGANKGIGFEIACILACTPGFSCIGTTRDAEAGRAAAAKIADLGGAVEFMQLDITSGESVEAVRKELESRGGLDVLVNNAGFAFKGDTFGADEAQQTQDVNYSGTKRICDALVPLLKENGRVVKYAPREGRPPPACPSRSCAACAARLGGSASCRRVCRPSSRLRI